MKTVLLSLILLFSLWPATQKTTGQWQVFKGAWFEIKYPAGFQPRPSQRSSTSETEYDSAFFTSNDGTAEFYVFSPMWNGTPADIEINPQREVIFSQTVSRAWGRVIRRVTIKARDGSYMRSFEDTEDKTNNTRKVFGIKYRDQATYNRYRQMYLTFKASLTQFSD